MTPQDHNKALGIMHLIYGGFFALMTMLMFVISLFMIPIFRSLPPEPNGPPPVLFMAFFGVFVLLYGLLSIPSIVAGYALLKRKTWARTAGIVAAFLSAISFPFGTALCVYSLWFFFGDAGKAFHSSGEAAAGAWAGNLNSAPATNDFGWESQRAREAERQRTYAPPTQPPDWRDS
jgi:hypothetical protein